MRSRILALIFGLFCISFQSIAQHNLTGRIVDATDTSSLVGVSISVNSTTDSNIKTGSVSDIDGNFSVSVLSGSYIVRFNYLGYRVVSQIVTITTSDKSLGIIKLSSSAKELKGVTVKDKQIRGTQLGDTSQFNADAYKTHPDATAEDLVTKMPGVTSDANGVKVNGESLQQVYVDGKPFFGNDPTLALKNLPAEIIDKIQVFDKLSDQSSFTGFDDGNSQKTMNIVTKGSKREGVFGKLYAGVGTENTYSAGGNVNFFHGDRRITLIGLSNNINLQNFSPQDLLGVSSGSGNNRGGGGGRGSFGGGGNSASNFFVGQQNGITSTNSAGFNYSDNWGKKLKVSGSYFFNGTDNVNNSEIDRIYNTNSTYNELDTADVRNTNHRVNMRFEYTIDSFNSVIFTPGVSFQSNNNSTTQRALSDTAEMPLSRTRNYNSADNNGYSSTDNLLIQHKFKKQRRTISLNVNTTLNDKKGTSIYNSDNTYFNITTHDSVATKFDQHSTIYNNGYTVSPNVTYTEPVGKKGQLMLSYNPSWSNSSSDKETHDKNATTNEYTTFDTALSNKYKTTYITQNGGLSYRVGDRKMTFSFGANMQYASLSGEQTFPYTFTVNRNFASILPTAMYNYRYSDGRNLRIMYRTNTVAPSVTQLQSVVDVSNPLLLKNGNPDLQQDYEHTLILRYGQTKSKTSRNFFVNIYANYINNYIANATIQPHRDMMYKDAHMRDSILIKSGSQLTLPVNLNGYFNERAFLTYSLPVGVIKSNLNFNGGLNYTRTPGLINNVVNNADNYIPSAGVVLSSNISSDLDFTLSYTGNYNFVYNTLASQTNSKYYSQTTSFKINYIFKKNLVFNTNLTHNYYAAFSGTGDQSFFLWNAYMGYKLLKNKALEARISAFDILNQNKSINRTVTGTYVENNISNALKQNFMFQLTYTIRNFKGQMPTLEDGPERMHGPGGFGPGGPGGRGGFGGPPPGGMQ